MANDHVFPEAGRWQRTALTEGTLRQARHCAATPLHHPAGGPPPRAGEDKL
jgi:hypothetical protein